MFFIITTQLCKCRNCYSKTELNLTILNDPDRVPPSSVLQGSNGLTYGMPNFVLCTFFIGHFPTSRQLEITGSRNEDTKADHHEDFSEVVTKFGSLRFLTETNYSKIFKLQA